MSPVDEGVVTLCRALGDRGRWALLERLAESPASASALATERPESRQAIVKQLGILREAGLVRAERWGRELVFAASADALAGAGQALAAIGEGWDLRLRAAKRALEG